jgi:hypothetical protein
MTNSRDDVVQIIESFFRYQEAFDGNGMLNVWHSGGRMYLVGNNNEFRVVSIEEQSEHINQVKNKVPDI